MIAVFDDKLTGYRCFLSAYALAKSMNAACKPQTLSAIPQQQGLWQTFRIESSDVPAATMPASQLNKLHSWYRASMCIFRRLFLEIEADQRARTADTCGYDQLEQRDSLAPAKSGLEEKKIARWAEVFAKANKQTNCKLCLREKAT